MGEIPDATDADSYVKATEVFGKLNEAYESAKADLEKRLEEEAKNTQETAKKIDKKYKDRPAVAKANTAGADTTNK